MTKLRSLLEEDIVRMQVSMANGGEGFGWIEEFGNEFQGVWFYLINPTLQLTKMGITTNLAHFLGSSSKHLHKNLTFRMQMFLKH